MKRFSVYLIGFACSLHCFSAIAQTAPPIGSDGTVAAEPLGTKQAEKRRRISRKVRRGHKGDPSNVVRLIPEDLQRLGVTSRAKCKVSYGKRTKVFRCKAYKLTEQRSNPMPDSVFMVKRARKRLGVKRGRRVVIRPVDKKRRSSSRATSKRAWSTR